METTKGDSQVLYVLVDAGYQAKFHGKCFPEPRTWSCRRGRSAV
jgi:hypothetical protein